MRICLIGAANPSNNPRLLREADLLSQSHEVRVVCAGAGRGFAEADTRLLARRSWKLQRTDSARADWMPSEAGRMQSVMVRGRRRLAEAAFSYVKTTGLAEYSCCSTLGELRRLASAESAHWFIAHTQPVLPAAAATAKRWNAKLGFDCEDLLSETGDRFCEAIRLIERKYFAACDYVSATSQHMANYLVNTYGIAPPVVLYNVFPLSLAQGMSPPTLRPTAPRLRLHWFGQTIGPDRGLQDVFAACSGLSELVEIHLRGRVSEEHRAVLLGEAARCGVASCLHFHPRVDHDDLIRSMAEYDVGLALERVQHRNYSLTVTNKVFAYLLAGLAVVATDTPGQREVMSQAPEAGALYATEVVTGLREILETWIRDREKLRRAQQAAWEAARSRFCWDIEQRKFLEVLGRMS
ncbi:MAG: glycosyltransferase [Candidatus Korobacteraceae bacterium]